MTVLVLEFVGAAGILAPFALAQVRRLSRHSYAYLALNVACSGILTGIALLDRQWGFLVVQGAWTLVAAVQLARRAARP